MAQDTLKVLQKQDKIQGATNCDLSRLPKSLSEFTQGSFLKFALTLYFQDHPAEDEVAAFAAHILKSLRPNANLDSLKSHIRKVIACQTSLELDYWMLLDSFVGLPILDKYLTERRTILGGVE